MKTSKALQLGAAIGETILAVPFLGAAIILGLFWVPLLIMLVIHIVSLVFVIKAKENTTGSILGILASTVGLIPGVGFVLHILAAIFNYKGALNK